jgi:hypothetical protein
MEQRKYERIKARLMQKKREAGDALKAIARKPGNPLVSREYGKAMDRYQKAKEALERHYLNKRGDTKPTAEVDTARVPNENLTFSTMPGVLSGMVGPKCALLP